MEFTICVLPEAETSIVMRPHGHRDDICKEVADKLVSECASCANQQTPLSE